MSLKREKSDIEFHNDDAIKRERIFFDFVQRTFNCLDGLYLPEKCILMDTIIENQSIKQSAEEVERLNRRKKQKQKQGRYIQAFSKKKAVL